MKTISLLSWNVNGLRAAFRKGFADWLAKTRPDILCLQETKARPEQVVGELAQVSGYHHHFVSAKKPGYSGVTLFSKDEPEKLASSFGVRRFDDEGRIIRADYGAFTLFNIYFPNGKASPERLRYKMDFYEAFLSEMKKLLKEDKRIVVCGDVNTAHTALDLARPKENEKVSGFLPLEREWIDRFLAAGFVDTLRMFEKGPGQYTWWHLKSGARARNVGWRLDYFYVSDNLKKNVTRAFILPEVQGSDHCPVGIEMR
ncbi:MAG: exodeoxyribonuclease III [Candidatus Edwardsbacteria bacterium]|nr:exodeoxyribonuclease III [Candidatus Edwardsbacteria bacterium]